MSQSKWSKTKRWLKERQTTISLALGISPVRLLMAAILLGGLGFLIFYLAFSKGSSASADVGPAPDETQKRVDEQIKALFERQLSDPNSFLISINEIQDTETESVDIEASHSLTRSQEDQIAQLRLKNKGAVVLLMLREGIGYHAERVDLIRFCETCRDVDNPELRNASRYWLCSLPAIELMKNPSEEKLKTFTDAIEQYESFYLEAPLEAKQLADIFIDALSKPSKHSEIIRKGAQELALHMQTSDTAGVRSISRQLIQLAIFSQYKLQTLGSRIAWNDPSASADLEGAITALNDNVKTVHAGVWHLIIRSYESHLANADVDKLATTWKRMWAISEQIESKEAKTYVQAKLGRQKHRATSIGRNFDLSGYRLRDGEPIEFGSYEYVAVVFIGEENDSLRLVQKLVTASQSKKPFYSLLVLDEGLSQQNLDRVKDTSSGFAIASVDTAKKYREELLVDIPPYIVLVDKAGKILNASLEFDQIESRIAQLKSSK